MTLDDIEITTEGIKVTDEYASGWLTNKEKELVKQVAEDTGEKYAELCKELYFKKMTLARKEYKENAQID